MKSAQRNGKIARLPLAVREELNVRIEDGEFGEVIVGWLNGRPEVQAMVAAEWEGREISEQNLSAWRNGGYRDWVEQRQAMELAVRLGENAAEFKDSTQPLAETLAVWVAARLLVATRRVQDAEGDEGWRLLRQFCGEVARVRRGDHNLERVRIERDRVGLEREQLEFARERQREKTEEEMWAWAMKEENRKRICAGCESKAEKIARIRKAYFADIDDPVFSAGVARDLAKTDLRPDDPGFAKLVVDIFIRGVRNCSGTAEMLAEVLEAQEAVKVDQGGSSLIKVEAEEGSPRRHEDSKGGERHVEVEGEGGAPRRHEDTKGKLQSEN